jgi:hypothetical protein
MSDRRIIQNSISRLGQSQDDRTPPELGPHFADVDERDGPALLGQAAALAKLLNFYRDNPDAVTSDWSRLFPEGISAGGLLSRDDGSVPPHLGLFASFLRLYERAQQTINTITGRHLDFQFRTVLRFEPRAAQPDHAHVLVELKKGAASTIVDPEQLLSAGKDARGVEVIFRPIRESVVNQGQVVSLRSVFRDAAGLHFAPIADSADGLGGALDPARPGWRPFGHAGLPPAQVGFALASPVLRMQEGSRTLKLDLQLTGLDPIRHTPSALAGAFEAHLTGPKGWLGPFPLIGGLTGDRLTLTVVLPPAVAAIVDYDVAIHGHAFAAQAPVVQLLVKPGASLRYADLEGLTLRKARIAVEVTGLTALDLENDAGSLNPQKAFQPFGAQPVPGSRFMVGSLEALSKRLLAIEVKLTWQGAPANLAEYYKGYLNGARMKNGVSASLIYQDRSAQVRSAVVDLMARDSSGASTLSPQSPPPATVLRENEFDSRLFALYSGGSLVSRLAGRRIALAQPIFTRTVVPAPEVRSGFLSISLIDDFLHADYRRETIANAFQQNKQVLNEPYTPTVRAISLNYRAESDEVDVGADDLASFTNLDLQFFHVGCFGQMREHAYLRGQVSYVDDQRVGLLPGYPYEGEFLIGISGVAAGDGVGLLLQVAEGTADPDLPPLPLAWSVMGDNYWRPLTAQELALDTGNELRRSGIVMLSLPTETTTEHTIVPTGLVWLRAAIDSGSRSVCDLVQVANNAVEVQFADQGNDPARLAVSLAAGSVSRFKTPLATIKQVAQPFAGFGGRPEESNVSVTRRAAERLRHRQRCITPWDYERMLLEAFPEVHRVKCIPHASETSWQAAGHVLLVVVPDLRNRNEADLLRPRVDIGTLSQMSEFVLRRCGIQVVVGVKNPRYQRVRLDFKVRFLPGRPFQFFRRQLQDALIRVLSPWAFDAQRTLEFGGQVYRSTLLTFVESLPYVDFVTDFKLLGPDSDAPQRDVPGLQAGTPDAILVSDDSHSIDEFDES